MKIHFVYLGILLLIFTSLFSMPIKMKNGNTINGRIVATNGAGLLIENERGNIVTNSFGEIDLQDLRQKLEKDSEKNLTVEPEKSTNQAVPDWRRMFAIGFDFCNDNSQYYSINNESYFPVNYGLIIEFAPSALISLGIWLHGHAGAVSVRVWDPPYFTNNTYVRNDYFRLIAGLELKFYPFNRVDPLRYLWVALNVSHYDQYIGIYYSEPEQSFSVKPGIYFGNKFVFGRQSSLYIEPYVGLQLTEFHGSAGMEIKSIFGIRAGWLLRDWKEPEAGQITTNQATNDGKAGNRSYSLSLDFGAESGLFVIFFNDTPNFFFYPGIEFEFPLSDNFSALIKINSQFGTRTSYIMSASYTFTQSDPYFFLNIKPGIGLKWYLFRSNLVLKNLWAGFGISYEMPVVPDFSISGEMTFYGSIGYKFVFGGDNGFYLEPYAGLGYNLTYPVIKYGISAGWMWN